jgi:hypothetical protein
MPADVSVEADRVANAAADVCARFCGDARCERDGCDPTGLGDEQLGRLGALSRRLRWEEREKELRDLCDQ